MSEPVRESKVSPAAMDLRHFDPAKLGSVPREWLSPAKMALSIFFDFFKTLYLHQKHIFCKSGNVKLLGLVCLIIWSRKIFFTTLCFFKSFVLVEIWKMSFSCGNPWIPQERSLLQMTSSWHHHKNVYLFNYKEIIFI